MIDRRDTNRKRDPLHVYFFVLEHGLLIDMICSNKWKYNNVDLNIWVNFDIRYESGNCYNHVLSRIVLGIIRVKDNL